jgi:hypothetical protein
MIFAIVSLMQECWKGTSREARLCEGNARPESGFLLECGSAPLPWPRNPMPCADRLDPTPPLAVDEKWVLETMFRDEGPMVRAIRQGQARRDDADRTPVRHLWLLAMFSPFCTALGKP